MEHLRPPPHLFLIHWIDNAFINIKTNYLCTSWWKPPPMFPMLDRHKSGIIGSLMLSDYGAIALTQVQLSTGINLWCAVSPPVWYAHLQQQPCVFVAQVFSDIRSVHVHWLTVALVLLHNYSSYFPWLGYPCANHMLSIICCSSCGLISF